VTNGAGSIGAGSQSVIIYIPKLLLSKSTRVDLRATVLHSLLHYVKPYLDTLLPDSWVNPIRSLFNFHLSAVVQESQAVADLVSAAFLNLSVSVCMMPTV
jgi:hypothetical protein